MMPFGSRFCSIFRTRLPELTKNKCSVIHYFFKKNEKIFAYMQFL